MLAAPAVASVVGVAGGAAAGIAAGVIAGAASLAAFGAVAKPVLSDALKASQAVAAAQANYNLAIASGTKQAAAYKTEQQALRKAYADKPQQARSKQPGLGQGVGRRKEIADADYCWRYAAVAQISN